MCPPKRDLGFLLKGSGSPGGSRGEKWGSRGGSWGSRGAWGSRGDNGGPGGDIGGPGEVAVPGGQRGYPGTILGSREGRTGRWGGGHCQECRQARWGPEVGYRVPGGAGGLREPLTACRCPRCRRRCRCPRGGRRAGAPGGRGGGQGRGGGGPACPGTASRHRDSSRAAVTSPPAPHCRDVTARHLRRQPRRRGRAAGAGAPRHPRPPPPPAPQSRPGRTQMRCKSGGGREWGMQMRFK